MSKILIVDDKPSKYSDLLNSIAQTVTSIDIQHDVDVVTCIKDGLAKLESQQYVLLVIDMLLPEVAWGQELEDGGVKLLHHLEEDPDLKLPNYIIGITASADRIPTVEQAFENKPWILLRTYNGAPWEGRLVALIKHAFEIEAQQDAATYQTDICLITALKDPEFLALSKTPIILGDPELIDTGTYVQKGTLESDGETLSLVVACCMRMGSTESALLTSKLIEKYHPKLMGLAGICAGYQDKVDFGDVIVANPCWEYTMSSKITRAPDGTLTITNAPDYLNIDEDIAARFDNLANDEAFLSQVYKNWPADKPRAQCKIHIGPSATGPAVIADDSVLKDIRQHQHRNTIGLEMEAYGVFSAVRRARRPRPLVFSAKAVCDFASFLKDDRYQKYAAYTSASVVYEFLKRHSADICKALN